MVWQLFSPKQMYYRVKKIRYPFFLNIHSAIGKRGTKWWTKKGGRHFLLFIFGPWVFADPALICINLLCIGDGYCIFGFLSDVMPRISDYHGVVKHAPNLCYCVGIDLTGWNKQNVLLLILPGTCIVDTRWRNVKCCRNVKSISLTASMFNANIEHLELYQ